MEEIVAVEYEPLPTAAPPAVTSPAPASHRERFARYAAGQAVAAFRYRVPLEEISAGAEGGAVVLWPVVGPMDAYLWGRIVVCLAGREAVAALGRAEDAPAETPRDTYWDYAPLPKGDDAHADVAEAWRIVPALEAAQRERWNALYRRAHGEAFALFEWGVNRAALRVLAGHLTRREAITGMEAAAIIAGVIARTPPGETNTSPAPPPARHLTATGRFPRTAVQ